MLSLILLLSLSLAAQSLSPFLNTRHSARDASGNVHFRFNSADASLANYGFFYKGTSWNEAALTPISTGEFEALVPYTMGSQMQYRLKGSTGYGAEMITFMQPPNYTGTAFPPALTDLALIGTDATGDSLMIYNPVLDITDSYVAANETKLFRAIKNVSGTFPTANSFTSYNVWMSTIASTTAIADSVVYAMIYTQNILGIISPGLYKLGVNADMTPSFERLGNIQSQVSGGTLYMACNWADLAADPGFGAWPNDLNTLMLTDGSMNLTIDLGSMTPAFNLGDNGVIGMIQFEYPVYQSAVNTLPVLTLNSYSHVSHVYNLTYTDADRDFPLEAQIRTYFEREGRLTRSNSDLTPFAMDVENGIYQYTGTVIDDNFFFQFSDNGIADVILYPPVANNDELLPAVSGLQCKMANPLARSIDTVSMALSGLSKASVELSLYNLKGQRVLDLPDYHPSQDNATIQWNPSREFRALPTGIYFFKIRQDKHVLNHKIIITR